MDVTTRTTGTTAAFALATATVWKAAGFDALAVITSARAGGFFLPRILASAIRLPGFEIRLILVTAAAVATALPILVPLNGVSLADALFKLTLAAREFSSALAF